MACLLYIFGLLLLVKSAPSLPVETEPPENGETTTEPANETSQNLYVTVYIIKSVVYEIGILTDADDADASNETHEQVDLSFFDPERNGSLIDLSNIPIPIQTNVSGVAVTGILPADLGSINLNDDGTASFNGTHFPILPNKQVKITRNISTNDLERSESILSGLSTFLGLDDLIKTDDKSEEKGCKIAHDKYDADDKDLRVEKLSGPDDEKEAR